MDDVDYEDLARRMTDPAISLSPPSTVLTGEAAAAEGRAFLLREYGSEDALERALRPGRPRVGDTSGASPTVRGRISSTDFAAFKLLEERTGKKQSELVREAVHLLLAEHQIRV
ncbi:MAG: ribbon-helix-helix domain-containing protein [Pseudolysinimonas sp.]|uniref:ribbon-helix-helix domain-containing protein n=1 Tax=Pseudolysinimonas sp. TaxID=2680009 RepID=UPI003265817E